MGQHDPDARGKQFLPFAFVTVVSFLTQFVYVFVQLRSSDRRFCISNFVDQLSNFVIMFNLLRTVPYGAHPGQTQGICKQLAPIPV